MQSYKLYSCCSVLIDTTVRRKIPQATVERLEDLRIKSFYARETFDGFDH
jgi:hypothetical protein